jgi:hypothetical protein
LLLLDQVAPALATRAVALSANHRTAAGKSSRHARRTGRRRLPRTALSWVMKDVAAMMASVVAGALLSSSDIQSNLAAHRGQAETGPAARLALDDGQGGARGASRDATTALAVGATRGHLGNPPIAADMPSRRQNGGL